MNDAASAVLLTRSAIVDPLSSLQRARAGVDAECRVHRAWDGLAVEHDSPGVLYEYGGAGRLRAVTDAEGARTEVDYEAVERGEASPVCFGSALTNFGVDVFLDWDDAGRDPAVLGTRLEALEDPSLVLKMITNRGVKVFPDGLPETFCTDHWRCRFVPLDTEEATFDEVLDLLSALHFVKIDVIKTEHLYTFDGVRGYSLGQGE